MPEFGLLAPAILVQLAILHGRIGRSQRALWFLERGLQFTGPLENLKVRLGRAALLINLGRYQEAHAELESVDLSEAPAYQVQQRLLHGELDWATGNLERAIQQFTAASQSAFALQATYEEFQCRLSLACIVGARRDFSVATDHMTRAQALITDRSDRLVYRFREVLLLYWMGTYKAQHALEELEALVVAFGEMGLLQEQCSVHLHIADILLELGRDGYTQELDRVQALSVSLQNQAFLSKEWTLLPILQKAPRSHMHESLVEGTSYSRYSRLEARDSFLQNGQ